MNDMVILITISKFLQVLLSLDLGSYVTLKVNFSIKINKILKVKQNKKA